MGSFGNICRLCCVEESDLIPIFNFLEHTRELQEKCKKYLNVEVTEEDYLPQYICNSCINKLDEVQEFIEQCQLAQRVLEDMHLHKIEASNRAQEVASNYSTEESGDVNNLVPSLLLQEEIIRRVKEHSKPSSDNGLTLETRKKSKRKRIPVKPRNIPRRSNSISYSEDDQANEFCVKPEPVDQEQMYAKESLISRDESTCRALAQRTTNEEDLDLDACAREPIVKIEEQNMRTEAYSDEEELDEDLNEVSDDEEFNSESESDEETDVTRYVARCSLCRRSFLALSSLLLHQHMVHRDEPGTATPLMCLYCSEKFRQYVLLSDHYRERHADRGSGKLPRLRQQLARKARDQKFRCIECNKQLSSRRAFKMHMDVHQQENSISDVDAKITKIKRGSKGMKVSVRCAICHIGCISLPKLRSHLSEFHPDKSGHLAPYQCPHCNKSYGTPSSLVHHRTSHSTSTVNCPVCDKVYHPKYLRKHMVVHQIERPFKCTVCEKSFKDVEGLRHHKLKHRPEQEKYKEICTICGTKFMNRGALNVHTNVVHNGIKAFRCNYCDQRFGSKSSAEIHERRHTGEKPFSCEICGWRCSSKGKLKVHSRVHSDVKPFECKTCGKRTRSKNEMRQHELIHTDTRPYPCQYCEKRFRSTSQLKIHVRQHTGERPYRCPHCVRSFCDFANYSKHMHRVHKKEFEEMQASKPVYRGMPGKDLASAAKMHFEPSHDSNISVGCSVVNSGSAAKLENAISADSYGTISSTSSPSPNAHDSEEVEKMVANAHVEEKAQRENGFIRSSADLTSVETMSCAQVSGPYQALQLLRPVHDQNQLLQQLQQQQFPHQLQSSQHPIAGNTAHSVQQQPVHHHSPSLPPAPQQQYLTALFPPLAAPPPAHQHHLPQPSRHVHQNNTVHASPTSHPPSHIPNPSPGTPDSVTHQAVVYGPATNPHHLPLDQSTTSITTTLAQQSGSSNGGALLLPHMQPLQQQHHSLQQHYHTSFTGNNLNLTSGVAYDPYRLQL